MSRAYDYVTVDVFTSERFAGNPLAVIPDARGLTTLEMQAIAREFNYPESTFVLPAQHPERTNADAHVRIFTPLTEVPFAGHPNIGTAFVLASKPELFGRRIGDKLIFEETAGLVPVDILRDGGAVSGARLEAPQQLSLSGHRTVAEVARAARMDLAAVVTAVHLPVIASVGLPFLIVELNSLATLGQLTREGDYRSILSLDGADAVLFYVRAADALEGTSRQIAIRARMMSPFDGIGEDPATGSANAALAALLMSLEPNVQQLGLTIDQGIEMGRPSRLDVTASQSNGKVTVHVEGRVATVRSGKIRV